MRDRCESRLSLLDSLEIVKHCEIVFQSVFGVIERERERKRVT